MGALFSEMIFNNGYVHCDPHPGNVLVKKADDGRISIILLDHGLYLVGIVAFLLQRQFGLILHHGSPPGFDEAMREE